MARPRRRDRLTMAVSFAAGALVGALFGLHAVISTTRVAVLAGAIVAGGALGGWLSVRYGERFWGLFSRWWFPPT